MIDPLRRLRIFVAMAARLLPGVRCSTACTEYRSPSWRMIIPGRSCVARISYAPDAYGILRQAVPIGCYFDSRSLGGSEMPDQKRAAHQNKIIDAGQSAGQREYAFAREFSGSTVRIALLLEYNLSELKIGAGGKNGGT